MRLRAEVDRLRKRLVLRADNHGIHGRRVLSELTKMTFLDYSGSGEAGVKRAALVDLRRHLGLFRPTVPGKKQAAQ